jgi:CheY-like chemotaxis protein
MIEPQGQKHGHRLIFPRLELPHFVLADRIRLKQVLINLLSNAIKYSQPGGAVVVECAPGTPERARTRISVRDSGAGLPPEKLAQLFQPFNRLGKESSSEEGTGIGLVMSKILVEMMGGSIGVESIVGVGSVFWFELDSTAAPNLAIEGGELAGVIQAKAPLEDAVSTLLYVEDNAANLKLVEQLVARRSDLRLLSARDGRLGIEMARAALPDVILREDPATAGIPVLAISASAMLGDIRKGLEAGFFRYLTKPIHVSEFMDAIDAVLEIAKSRRTDRTT